MTIASYEASAKKKNNNQEKSRNSILKSKKIGAKHHGMAYNHRSENSLRTWIYFCSALFLLVSQKNFSSIITFLVGPKEGIKIWEGGGHSGVKAVLLQSYCKSLVLNPMI